VTDADAVLGYLNDGDGDSDLGRLDLDAARQSIRVHVAQPLGLSVEAAAAGIFALANAQMAGAVRLVSMAKGHDPRDFALMAFGGAGPVHAWAVADELEIGRVVIPPFAGINSAVGLLQADFRVDLGRGYRTTLSGERAAGIAGTLHELAEEATASLLEQGHRAADIVVAYAADMRYVGQSYDVLVDFPRGADDLAGLAAAFHAEHERAFGHAHPGDEVEITVLRVSATAPGIGFDFGDARAAAGGEARRRVRFGDADRDARVVRRTAVTDAPVAGPALLEESQTTIVVPPHGTASADAAGFVTILLDRGGKGE
jgi:N-methylhydantoinase A